MMEVEPGNREHAAAPLARAVYVATPKDVVGFWRWLHENEPAYTQPVQAMRKKLLYLLLTWVSLALISVGTLIFYFDWFLDGVGYARSVVLLSAVTSLSIWVSWQEKRLRLKPAEIEGYYRQVANRPECRYFTGPHVITLYKDLLVYEAVHETVYQKWTGIEQIRRTPDAILTERADGRVFIAPLRAFQSTEAAAAFEKAARECLEAAGGGTMGQLRQYLAERDVPCPKCKHNLRGLRSANCPECGLILDQSTLPAAF